MKQKDFQVAHYRIVIPEHYNLEDEKIIICNVYEDWPLIIKRNQLQEILDELKLQGLDDFLEGK